MKKKIFILLGIAAILLAGRLGVDLIGESAFLQHDKRSTEQAQKERDSSADKHATVVFVVDGDTIEIENGERMRLIGIDAPEREEPGYWEAKQKLEELVLNKHVRLEQDVSDRDEYGRLLRYLYAGDMFVNLEMVKQGYAEPFPYPPDTSHARELQAAEPR